MAYSKNRRLADIIADTDGNLSAVGITVPTQSASDNDTSAASTAYVTTAVNNLIDSAPGTMNTLNEIAAAINDDADFNTTVNTAINLKAPLASPDFTGDVTFDTSTLVVDSTNNRVGINQASPSHGLHIVGGSNTEARVRVHNSASGQASLDLDNSEGYFRMFTDGGELRFYDQTDGTYRLVIDTSGKLLIGDTASHVDDLLQIETPASGGGHGIQIRRNDSNNDQGIGRILFGNNTDTDLASIYVKTDGATDNAAITFNTQPTGGALTERMRIASGGNVGIGTNNPSDRLVVQKDSANIEPILVLKNDNTTDDNGVSIDFSGKDNSGNNVLFGRIAAKYTNHNTEKSHMIFTHRNDSGTFAEGFRLTHDGNMGIGEDSPHGKLHVKGSDSGATADSGANTLVLEGSGNSGLSILSGASSSGSIYFGDSGSAYDGYINYSQSNSRMGFATSGTGRMYIASDGKIGMGPGKSSPTHQVHIHSDNDNAYALRIEGSTNNAAVWTGIGIGGEESNTKSAIIFKDIASSYSRGDLMLCVNNDTNQDQADPDDAKWTVKHTGHIHGEVLNNSNSNPLGSGTNSGKLWSTSGNWINVWYVGNDEYGVRYFYEMDIQGLHGYTSYGEVYKDRNGRWHINKIRSQGTDIQVEGNNNYLQINQNSGANQTNSAGNFTLVRAPGTT